MIELRGDWKSIERMDTNNYDFVICMAEKKFAEEEERNGNCVIFVNRPDFKVAYAAYKSKLYDLIDPPANSNYFHIIRLIERDADTETRDRYRTVVGNQNTECVPVITNEHNYIFKDKYTFPSTIMEKGHAYMVRPKGEDEYVITNYRYVGEVCEEEYSSRFHWQHVDQRVISNDVNITDHDGDHLSINITANPIGRVENQAIRSIINHARTQNQIISGITDAYKIIMTPEIDRVIWNGPATVVFWKDGTKTVVKCEDKDDFDKEKGLAMAFMKKVLGNKGNYYNYIRKWLPKEKPSSDQNILKNTASSIIFDEVVTEVSVESSGWDKDIYTIKLKNGTQIKCTLEGVPFFVKAFQKFIESHSNSQK